MMISEQTQVEVILGNDVLENVEGVDDIAKKWGMSPGYIKNLCAKGKIQAKKIGKTWVIDKRQEKPSSRGDV